MVAAEVAATNVERMATWRGTARQLATVVVVEGAGARDAINVVKKAILPENVLRIQMKVCIQNRLSVPVKPYRPLSCAVFQCMMKVEIKSFHTKVKASKSDRWFWGYSHKRGIKFPYMNVACQVRP